jgi:hypothetical protein
LFVGTPYKGLAVLRARAAFSLLLAPRNATNRRTKFGVVIFLGTGRVAVTKQRGRTVTIAIELEVAGVQFRPDLLERSWIGGGEVVLLAEVHLMS